MSFWGFYERDLRVVDVVRLVIRRVRCQRCACSHALLPDFAAQGRLDSIEVIGSALEAMAEGAGVRPAAKAAGVAHTTVRGWRWRFEARAPMLTAGFCAAAVALGGLAPRLPAGALAACAAAIGAAGTAAALRLGAVSGSWRVANRIIGGQLLTTNTDPLFSAR